MSLDHNHGERAPRGIDRALVRSLYAKEVEAGKHGAIRRVHQKLALRGINCIYGTVRYILSGKMDSALGRQTASRFAIAPLGAKRAHLPPINTPALSEGRTQYPSTVVRELTGVRVLKSGFNSSKIGGRVLKGAWKGMPIFTLTLEERATCPPDCRHWRSCYGGSMQLAQRIAHDGPEFERKLVEEVLALGREHPKGFVVRLHVLGDFYSVRYVQLWQVLLETVPALHCFGYSARNNDEIGQALRKLVAAHWGRFAVRFSNAIDPVPSTLSIEHPIQRPPTAFICPAQTGRTESCSACAACWSTKKTVCFLQH